MSGFGEIVVERDEPTFHEAWESLAFGLNVLAIAQLRAYNVDEYRHAVERMSPAHYLTASYYERTLTAVATLLVEKGVVDRATLLARAGGAFPLAQAVADVAPDGVTPPPEPRFALGDRVRVREMHPAGHTRAPRYVRGHVGEVVHVAPRFSFPDHAAHGLERRKEPTYHVLFSAEELWNDAAGSGESVVVDLWESYLLPAESGSGGVEPVDG